MSLSHGPYLSLHGAVGVGVGVGVVVAMRITVVVATATQGHIAKGGRCDDSA